MTKRFRVLSVAGAAVGVLFLTGRLLTSGSINAAAFLSIVCLFAFVAAIVWVTDRDNTRLEREVRVRSEALERMSDQLRDASVRQEAFVSHVSHELFTPLTTIVGTMNMLSEPDVLPAQQIPHLAEMAARSTERMTQRVDDLMLASGLTRFVAYDRLPFDLGEQISLTLENFEPVDKFVEVDVTNGGHAVGDVERFRTALRHLLSNANKFGPPGSIIRVEGRMNGTGSSVTVFDQGPGIHPDHRDAVFEGFRQFDAPTRVHEGLGLGLFVAREVARGMGGDVTIEDVPLGCAVKISLPSGEKQVGRFGRRSLAAAVAASLILVSGGALAATGRLPGPIQDAVAKVANAVGVKIPDSDDAQGERDRLNAEQEKAYQAAQRAWALCVSMRAREHAGSRFDTEEVCGEKPEREDFENARNTQPDGVAPAKSADNPIATDQIEKATGNASDEVLDVPDTVSESANRSANAANDAASNVGGTVEETTEDTGGEADPIDPVEETVEEEVEDVGDAVGDTVGGLGKAKKP